MRVDTTVLWPSPFYRLHLHYSELLFLTNLSSAEKLWEVLYSQGVTIRCRPAWLTNRALVYEPQLRGRELWGLIQWVQLYNSIFNLCVQYATCRICFHTVRLRCTQRKLAQLSHIHSYPFPPSTNTTHAQSKLCILFAEFHRNPTEDK